MKITTTLTERRADISNPSTRKSVKIYPVNNLPRDAEIYSDVRLVISNARELEDNAAIVEGALKEYVKNVVGSKGFAFRNKAMLRNGKPNERVNKMITDAFNEWCSAKYCDVSTRRNFVAMQKLWIRGIIRDGEVFVRIVRDYDEKNNKFSFALQLVDPMLIDINYNENLSNGNKIIMGIETDTWNKPVRYYIRKSVQNVYGYNDTGRMSLSADEVIHWQKPRRYDETRSYSWLTPVLIRLLQMDRFNKSTLENAIVSAIKLGFLSKKTNFTDFGYSENERISLMAKDRDGQPILNNVNTDDTGKEQIINTDNGSITQLDDNTEFFKFDTNYPSEQYVPFDKQHKRDVGFGLGLAYSTIGNDSSESNFSSSRMAMAAEHDNWSDWQQEMIDGLLIPIYEAWLDWVLTKGRILPISYDMKQQVNAPLFIGRTWSYINPVDDQKANAMALQNGTKSRTQICAETGQVFEDVVKELAKEKELIESLDLEDQLLSQKDKTVQAPDEPQIKQNNNNKDNVDGEQD